MKLLETATAWWLSHGGAKIQVISRFKPLVTIIQRKNDPELRGTRDQLLDPDNVLKLSLLADVLTLVNRFSKFLQTCNLICTNVNAKLFQFKSALKCIEVNDGPLFMKHAVSFLELAFKKMEFSRRFCNNNLMSDEESDKKSYCRFNRYVFFPEKFNFCKTN